MVEKQDPHKFSCFQTQEIRAWKLAAYVLNRELLACLTYFLDLVLQKQNTQGSKLWLGGGGLGLVGVKSFFLGEGGHTLPHEYKINIY